MRTVLLSLGLLVCTGAGCLSADEEGTETLDQETKVKPKGDEVYTTGTVRVTAPKGALLAPTRTFIASAGKGADWFRFVAAQGLLGETFTVPAGKYDVLIEGAQSTVFATTEVKVGQSALVELPALAPIGVAKTAAPSSKSVKVDIGPTVTALPSQAIPTFAPIHYVNPIESAVGTVLVPGTSYEVRNGPNVVATLAVPKGATGLFTVGPVPDMWWVPNVATGKVEIALAASEFPLRSYLTLSWGCDDPLKRLQFDRSAGNMVLVQLGAVAPKKTFSGSIISNSACKYQLGGLANGPVIVSGGHVDVPVIDVDDVVVSNPNGFGSRTVPGSFRVSQVVTGGKPVELAGTYPTKVAVPVLPGTYRIDVNYNDLDGPGTYTETVTVP